MSGMEAPVHDPTRRSFLAQAPAVGLAALVPTLVTPASPSAGALVPDTRVPDWLPRQSPQLVQEVVAESHRSLARVRELVERQPALANATVDWGFGDWESALGAASHVGQRDIAELLLAHGAAPTLFSAAMLGQLDVVKALVAARPGVQRTLGPHGITLLAHARAGKATAEPVAAFLATLGDADTRTPTAPLAPADRDAVVGEYRFGPGERDRFVVDVERDVLGIVRPGGSRRNLFHTGQLVFFPVGAPAVKVAFAREGGAVRRLSVADPEVLVTAERV
jgi:hypothetical protein